jgi:chromosome partitioning protein
VWYFLEKLLAIFPMQTITIASFNGGQGKSSTVLTLGRMLSEGYRVLLVDCEPQSSLTSWILGKYLDPDMNSVREVLEGGALVTESIYRLSKTLALLPSDSSLLRAEATLAASGRGAYLLRKRLKEVDGEFDFCLIDTPPEPIQIAIAALGAASGVIIPATADLKGVQALGRTVSILNELADDLGLEIPVIGGIPYKVPMYGNSLLIDARAAIKSMEDIAAECGFDMMPMVIRSDRFERALTTQKTLAEVGLGNLELPFQAIAEKLTGKGASEWRTTTAEAA